MKNITSSNFRRYGRIIEYPNFQKKGKKRNLWRIVHASESPTGWRVAYLVVRDRTIGRLECHPNSDETLEPISGKALLFVSLTQDFSKVECFKLDRPVILYKGVWHGVISVSAETHIKIMENGWVQCVYWPLGFRMDLKKWQKKTTEISEILKD